MPADVRGQLARRRVTPVRVLRERLGRDRLDVAATARVEGAQPGGLFLPNDPGSIGQGQMLQGIGQPAGQQLEEDHPQGVHVRALVQPRVGRDLFGAHVVQGTDHLPGPGMGRGGPQVGGVGHAKVEHFGLPRRLHQDVGRLEVAVDDAALVGVLHRVAHPRHQSEPAARVEGVFAAVLVERYAGD